MPSLNKAVNRLKYIQAHWAMVTVGCLLTVAAVLVAEPFLRIGGNALAEYYDGSGYDQGGYGAADQSGYPAGSGYGDSNGSYQNNGYAAVPSGGYGGFDNTGYPASSFAGSSAGAPGGGGLYPDYSNAGNPGTQLAGNSQPFSGNPQAPTLTSAPSASATPLASTSLSPSPTVNVNNNTNTNNANPTINVLVGHTGRSSGGPSLPAPVTMLPQTGPGLSLMLGGVGLAGTIVAGSFYASSRRDLRGLVFKR